MKTEDFENDEEIHHSAGKDYVYPCPSELTFAQSGASSPINISPLATISPPGMHLVLEQQKLEQGKPHGKLKRFLKRVFAFKKHKKQESNNNQYFIEKLTLEVSDDIFSNVKKDNMINNINAFYCVIMNSDNNSDKKEQSNEKEGKEEPDDADHSEVVEVQPTSAKESAVKQSDLNKDYSNSKLVPLLTYPEQANYLIGWMHLNIERQPKISERIRIIKALDSRYYFKSKVGYKDYIGEFGGDFTASWYSRLMKREIPSDVLDVILESLDTSIFPIKK